MPAPPNTTLFQASVPVLGLLVLIGYGLVYRPLVQHAPPLPLELIFILAATWTVGYLRFLGHRWRDVQQSIVAKLARALPAFFILFCIGLIISSWVISGTIPMLVYWGLSLVDPGWLYLIAFLATIIFSTLTGTSWGSVGTVGVVLMGMAAALDANLGITAGAVIGGAYFGDKMSPLSDTTNLAALAADVDLYDHIQSMAYTTLPSAVLAGIVYALLGWTHQPVANSAQLETVAQFLDELKRCFHFSVWLLIPPAIVLVGSFRRLPTVPLLILSVGSAAVLAIWQQSFSLTHVFQAIHTGFDSQTMVTWTEVSPRVAQLLDRGGLYALDQAIITAFMVFVFIGAMDHIQAMPTVVQALLRPVKTIRGTILTTLAATGLANAMTSNQYATSFIIGDAFQARYDALGIPRRVLSRSLEDTGTMIESIIPWTTTALFMVQTLGVPFAEYWHWQLLSLINIAVAVFYALTGIACFAPGPDRRANIG